MVTIVPLTSTKAGARGRLEEDRCTPDPVIARLSPARDQHINPYGSYTFNDEALRRPAQRPPPPPFDEVRLSLLAQMVRVSADPYMDANS